ncbi:MULTISPECIES: cupredoxin domain-containing protein [Lysinibacillus]|nr:MULTISPECIES: cupredoxin domain-containing protein [Lysinibacillus]MBX8947044.1 copper-binding protein [Lysinibacillus sp. K60]QTB26931.1 cupredoxin domain-containing protein [Lysinibacillus sphaericus]
MGFYQMFVLVSLMFLLLIVIMVSRIMKKTIKPMQGMTISMFFSMNVGLTLGILFGVTFQGNLFYSTIISIILGASIGFLSGCNFGLLPMLEGLMAGLMAGMMGAMLGEMVDGGQSIVLIRIFLLLSIFTIFLFALLPSKSQKTFQSQMGFLTPFFFSVFILFYFFGGIPFAEKQINFIKDSSLVDHNLHSNAQNKLEKKEIKIISIETENMKYSPSEVILEKNQPVSLELINKDNIEHDIEVTIPTSNTISSNNHVHHKKEENMIHLHVGPKNTEKMSFTPINTGEYQFVCTIPGHKELGMVGKFIIK